jgi:hypothetical protein
MFPQQLISGFGGINLPPQKPNFKAVDFFPVDLPEGQGV